MARALKKPGEIGEIASGAHADLIAISCKESKANPYDAILNHQGPVNEMWTSGQRIRICELKQGKTDIR